MIIIAGPTAARSIKDKHQEAIKRAAEKLKGRNILGVMFRMYEI
jgi:hypothetical protein